MIKDYEEKKTFMRYMYCYEDMFTAFNKILADNGYTRVRRKTFEQLFQEVYL